MKVERDALLAIDYWQRATDAARKRRDEALVENKRLRRALMHVEFECLSSIRRAAFTPELGVRYSEKIRLDISGECRKLEDYIREVLG